MKYKLVCNRQTSTTRNTTGFSLVEAVVATLIVGILLVAVMNTVGFSNAAQYKSTEQARGEALAQAIMAEILNQAYEEPDDIPSFGRESSESGGSRTTWDDVDDFNEWSASPPEQPDSTQLPNFNGWTRRVSVEWVNPNDLSQTASTETGVKRITVTIERNNRVIASLIAIRTNMRETQANNTTI